MVTRKIWVFHPSCIGHVRCWPQATALETAEIIGDHVVVSYAAIKPHDTLEQREKFHWLNIESCLFADFAPHTFPQALAKFHHAAGKCPFAQLRFFSTTDEQNRSVPNCHAADTQNRQFRKLTLHRRNQRVVWF